MASTVSTARLEPSLSRQTLPLALIARLAVIIQSKAQPVALTVPLELTQAFPEVTVVSVVQRVHLVIWSAPPVSRIALLVIQDFTAEQVRRFLSNVAQEPMEPAGAWLQPLALWVARTAPREATAKAEAV